MKNYPRWDFTDKCVKILLGVPKVNLQLSLVEQRHVKATAQVNLFHGPVEVTPVATFAMVYWTAWTALMNLVVRDMGAIL